MEKSLLQKWKAFFLGFSVLCLLFLSLTYSHADKPKEFSRETWEEQREDLSWDAREKREEEREGFRLPTFSSGLGLSQLAKEVITLVFIFLVFFILFLFVQKMINTPKNEKKKHAPSGAQLRLPDEAGLLQGDFEAEMRNALAKEDYKEALRAAYLLGMQHFVLQKAIRWKRSKTNTLYLRELPGAEWKSTIRPLMQAFERTFYAEYPFTAEAWAQIPPQITQILSLQQDEKTPE